MNKNRKSTSGLMIIALLGLIIMAFILFSTGGDTQTMKYSEVIDYFEQGKVSEFVLNMKNGAMQLTLTEEATQELLERNGLRQRAELLLESHTNMGLYERKETVDGIFFNFGYLPGGDHSLATKPENSLRAILEGLELLKKDGVMSLCIYSGGDTGFEERDSILEMLKILDSRKYVVILSTYYNRENNPPIPVLVIKK